MAEAATPLLRGRAQALKRRLAARAAGVRLALRAAWAERFDPEFAACRRDDPLICVITGMEHSGTTLISQLLIGHPRVAAGVECGLLLSEIWNFDRIAPFYDWMTCGNWGWALLPEDRVRLLRARSYEEAYCLLGRFKGRGHSDGELRALYMDSDLIFDKTPKYIYDLQKVIQKTRKPFVITVKSPLEAVASMQKRNVGINAYLEKYVRAMRQIELAWREASDRMLLVSYRSLATDPEATMEHVRNFVGLDEGGALTLARYNERFGRLIESRNSFRNDAVTYRAPPPPRSAEERAILSRLERDEAELLRFISDCAL